ncbi:MAG: histidine phosphatase family protein [Deltaproteobacteria bacterium]|nr:histidine phosphatase family protein [Deltaproteobacteria bacterium]
MASLDHHRKFRPTEPSPPIPQRRIPQLARRSWTQLIVIRHGHIAANGGELHAPMAGWTDLSLSPRGLLETEQLRQHLAGGMRFEAIYSSSLSRATDTARPLADAGLGPLHLCPALREINCGEMDGVPIAEIQHRFPELWRENRRQAREDFRWPGGESYREFRDRCLATVRGIAADHLSGRVAIVTHAGVISQIVGSICGLSPACWEPFRPGNASVSELAWHGLGGVIVSFDCRDHLERIGYL